jgi:hypothetical protein
MQMKSVLSTVALAFLAAGVFVATPSVANAEASTSDVTTTYTQEAPVYVSPTGESSEHTNVVSPTETTISDGGVVVQAVPSPVIKCKQTNANLRTCNIAVAGAYCGSSRRPGVGITTKLGGGIVAAPSGERISWKASSTVKDHNFTVGGTFSAVVSLNGKSSDVPYATCSL